jgi:endonuclease/exonuclease/phosphatase (EEP) superfamily protein YafD
VKKMVRNYLLAFSDMIFVLFFVWYVLSVFTHGRFVLVSLANMFAFQFFLLLIPFALVGFFFQIRRFQIASLVALVLFVFTFGKFFIPKQKDVPSSPEVLKVMTYNMLAFTPDVSVVADVIREEDADIVFMQETSFAMADFLQNEMLDEYPYQINFPSDIPTGIDVISKFPFEKMDFEMGGDWVGEPILLAVNWNGQTIHVVNFHMEPTALELFSRPERIQQVSNIRVRQAQYLVKFMQAHPGPVIFAGDANEVFLNNPYLVLVQSGLQDAWAKAGFGLGHTFPGNKSPGTSRVHFGGLFIPEWLVRIDYIFASQEWEVLSAHIARTDGYSDHRGVVAFLRLK